MKREQKYSSGYGHCLKIMGGLLIAGGTAYWLLPEFRAQIADSLPFLILLLCPLIHIFMHKGHSEQHSEPREHHKGS
ncbi:DUF2933 domain-containing protein [Malonomonas rubra]|uniref:DUF2933 domain-containing protein n=1 Tax=Malonomonas rubra TaxID=57040 RepID=UPI0026EBF7EE|nr:DUF2933 domain-containing protein [Malonomonas rubra]